MAVVDLESLDELRSRGMRKLLPDVPRIGVGLGTCGAGNGAHDVFHALSDALDRKGVPARLTTVGCFGYCAAEPLINVHAPGLPLLVLARVTTKDAGTIVEALAHHRPAVEKALCRIERWDHLTGDVVYGEGVHQVPHWSEVPFFAGQKKIVLRNCGLINPQDIEEYAAVGGYRALHDVLKQMTPQRVIDEVKKSRLRGRGGAGFPTGNKWEILNKAQARQKYIVCNADEGDPGAYMNRNEIESDPHTLLEGLVIGGYAMGAAEAVIYVRAEYPLAVLRLKQAIEQARAHGLLGHSIFGSGFSFDIRLVEGAGAFVCGEETALIASLEGRAGRPRPRPPFPGEKGLWGCPTNINNVETWFNIPVIIARGADWYRQTGTEKSAGTKVFSLVGKVQNTGLVEMPLGSPLRQIVYDIGGGTGDLRKVKAVQTGGPSGGCIPAERFDTPVDYESLAALGSIMGSGGMVVMDDDNCMVDVARYFIGFSQAESCGKCVPCRVGLNHALRILEDVTRGTASDDALQTLEELGQMIKETSLCGLGQTAPNPVLTTLKYFRHEYLQHVRECRCAASVCGDLFLSPCANTCPLQMNIPGYLELMREGRLRDAGLMVVLDNPLAGSTGRVCQHPCEARCRRREIDQPVAIRDMHRLIVDRLFRENAWDELARAVVERKRPATVKRVGIVGGGPAGLTAAFYLALLGHDVTVLESADRPGGMLRYALPHYRLPKPVIDREIKLIEDLGVKFVFNVRIGKDRRVDELAVEFDAVLLTIGTWDEQSPDIPGARHAITAIQFLGQVARDGTAPIGKSVLVVGGGNAAIDAARTALRLGSDVTVVYRRARQDMPAIAEEVEQAASEGVKFHFLAIPNSVLVGADGSVEGLEVTEAALGAHDRFGRRAPNPTRRTAVLAADTVILALGERVDTETVRAAGVKLGRGDTIEVDAVSLATSRSNVYAAGDVVTGPANVVTAMGQGKRAAGAIDAALTGIAGRMNQLTADIVYGRHVPREPRGGPGRRAPINLPKDAAGNFDEVSAGLGDEDAAEEASRCLRCDVKECVRAAATLEEAPVTSVAGAPVRQEVTS